jgi:hypothetical protein
MSSLGHRTPILVSNPFPIPNSCTVEYIWQQFVLVSYYSLRERKFFAGVRPLSLLDAPSPACLEQLGKAWKLERRKLCRPTERSIKPGLISPEYIFLQFIIHQYILLKNH